MVDSAFAKAQDDERLQCLEAQVAGLVATEASATRAEIRRDAALLHERVKDEAP